MTTSTSALTALVAFAVTIVFSVGLLGALWLWRSAEPLPTITSVDPFVALDVSQVPVSGLLLRISGMNFQQGASVQLYTHTATRVHVESPTEITATIPRDALAAGWFDLLVRNPDGRFVIARSAIGVRDSALAKVPGKYFTIKQQNDRITYASEGGVQSTGSVGYDNYPNIGVGSFSVASIDMAPYEQTFADRYDYLFGVLPGGATALNTRMQSFPYADMTEYNNGLPQSGRDGHTDAKITSFVNSYNASHDPDIQAEDFYLHAKCDCDMLYGTPGHCQTYSASDPQCTQTAGCPYSFITGTKTQYKGWNPDSPGTPNTGCNASTATTRAESRMMSAYLPQWDVPNYVHPQLADYFAQTFQNENIYWAGGTSAVSGVNFDTVVKDNHMAFADGMHMSWEYWGADVRSTTTPAQPFYDYFTLQQNVRAKLSSNAGQSAFRYPGNVITVPNEYPLSIYTPDTLASVQDNLVEVFFDHYQNGSNTYQNECGQWKSLLDETNNQGERFFLNSYERVGSYCTGGTTYDCRTDRGKIESLAMYYLLQNALTSYLYAADVEPFTPDALWNPAVTVDIGQPTIMPSGAKDIFGTIGTDNFYNFDDQSGGFTCPITSSTPTDAVYARNYTNGLVLVKHRHDWTDSVIYGDESSSDVTKKAYALDGYYRPVLADGTIGAPTNAVTLSNSQGAILLRNQAPAVGPTSDQTVTENMAFSFDVTATDPDGDTVGLTAAGIPSGAHFTDLGSGRGQFTWTPTYEQSGTYALTVIAADYEKTASRQITVAVSNADRAPVFAPMDQKTGTEGMLFAFTVAATDPDNDPVTLTATSLPGGATFSDHGDNTATFRWQPSYTQAGSYAVRVQASDGTLTANADVAIVIRDALPNASDMTGAPRMSPIGHQAAAVGDLLAFTVTATAASGATASLSATNLPEGAKYTDYRDNTATFRWIPGTGQEGVYNDIIFSASDGKQSTSETISITVLPGGSGGAYVDSKNFTAFLGTVKTGFSIASGNVLGDPREEVIVGTKSGTANRVRVFSNDGKLRADFSPYASPFRGGVRVTACDLDADGTEEIVTAPGSGHKPFVRIFDGVGRRVLKKQFAALDGKFTGGLNIACGDLDGDGAAEIVVAGSRGAASVVVYRQNGSRISSFQPYGKSFNGGITVAVLRGTSSLQIVTAPESGTKPVRRFALQGRQIGGNMYPFGKPYGGGIALAAGDVDGIGAGSMLIAQLSAKIPRIRVYTADSAYLRQFTPFASKGLTGANIAAGDVNGDGVADIVAVPASKNSAMVRMFDGHGGAL